MVIRNGEVVRYRRSGSCLACGECCARFFYTCRTAEGEHGPAEEGKEADLSQYEGWAIEDWDDPDKLRWWGPFEIEEITPERRRELCPSFHADTNMCDLFGTEQWKELCRKFPFRPEDLEGIKHCGFTFKELE